MSRAKNIDKTTDTPVNADLDVSQAVADAVAARGYYGTRPEEPASKPLTEQISQTTDTEQDTEQETNE